MTETVDAAAQVVKCLTGDQTICAAENLTRRALIERESARGSTRGVDSQLAEDQLVGVDPQVRVADQKDIVGAGTDHGAQHPPMCGGQV